MIGSATTSSNTERTTSSNNDPANQMVGHCAPCDVILSISVVSRPGAPTTAPGHINWIVEETVTTHILSNNILALRMSDLAQLI